MWCNVDFSGLKRILVTEGAKRTLVDGVVVVVGCTGGDGLCCVCAM